MLLYIYEHMKMFNFFYCTECIKKNYLILYSSNYKTQDEQARIDVYLESVWPKVS